MAIVVEHEKRKKEILNKAFSVFIEQGYSNVTFKKIADRCAITRTTLYLYFKNKREIFLFSIKQFTESLEEKWQKISVKKYSTMQQLNCLIDLLMDSIDENKKFFTVLLPYLFDLQKTGVDTKKRVMRRVLRIRHILSGVIIAGQKSGEFKKISITEINNLFFEMLKAAIFNVVFFAEENVESTRNILKKIVQSFCVAD